jgi:hypothetical protein
MFVLVQSGTNIIMIIKIFLSVIAVLFIAISYELHQIGDVNLYAWYGSGGLMVVLRTIRAVQLSKL